MALTIKKKLLYLLLVFSFIFTSALHGNINYLLFMDGFEPRLKTSDYNGAICTASEDQESPVICSDGLGGVIIAWKDSRFNSSGDIFAQRVNAQDGILWQSNGVSICLAGGEQKNIQICSDGNGGAIIAWQDDRYGSWDVYAQHVNSTGDISWSLGGEVVSINAGERENVQMCSDGEGGAILTWQENNSVTWDIYTQRLTMDGDMNWSTSGEEICTIDQNQFFPQICSDGDDGAFITWYGRKSNISLSSSDIFVQKINSTGDVQWIVDGIVICNESESQYNPQIYSIENESAIIAWVDSRLLTTKCVYTQCVDSNGTCWDANGVGISCPISSGAKPQISKHPGGTLISWEGSFPGVSNPGEMDISCKSIDHSGVASSELYVITRDFDQFYVKSCDNGVNGSILVWVDYREEIESDIYAQLVTSNMQRGWRISSGDSGVSVCTATGNQFSPQICSDGLGGAYIVWTDRRSLSHYDIYAEFIDYNGDILWGDQGFSGTPGIPGFDIFIVIGLTGLIAILISKKLNILKMKVI